MIRWAVPVLVCLAFRPALADESTDPIQMFIECSGVYDAASHSLADSTPSVAQLYRNMANGAEIAVAALVVATKGELDNQDWRSALAYAEGQRDISGTFWKAAIELGNVEDFGRELNFCVSMAEHQEAIVNEARNMMYGLDLR